MSSDALSWRLAAAVVAGNLRSHRSLTGTNRLPGLAA